MILTDKENYERLMVIEAAMREWFNAKKANDMKRWLEACRQMDTLMGGTWEADDPPLDTIDFERQLPDPKGSGS